MVTIWSQGASGDQNPLLTRPATNALASKSGAAITGYELVRESVEGPLREGKVPHGTLDAKVADNFERWAGDVRGAAGAGHARHPASRSRRVSAAWSPSGAGRGS